MRRGVTLIELLIAVSLLGMLSAGILVSMRVGLNAMDKGTAKLIANRRSANVQRILHSQIAGLIPVTTPCGVDQEVGTAPLFEGKPNILRFVSTYSLEEGARGYPRMLEFQVIPGAGERGVRLVVNETVYGAGLIPPVCTGIAADPDTGMPIPQVRPMVVGPQSFVLADRLAFCRFLYKLVRPGEEDRWLPTWNQQQWPAAVHVEMAPLETDPSRVPLVSMTAAIRGTKLPNVNYGE